MYATGSEKTTLATQEREADRSSGLVLLLVLALDLHGKKESENE